MAAVQLDAARPKARGLQRSEHKLLLTIGDGACAALAVLLALWAWSITTGFAFDERFLRRSAEWAWLVPIWAALLIPSRRLPAALSLQSTIRSVFRAEVAVLALYAATYFYAPPRALPRLPALYFFWEAFLLTLAWRLTYLFIFTAAGFRRRAAVIGSGPAAARIAGLLKELSPDVEVVASLDETGPEASTLKALVERERVSELVVSSEKLPPQLVQDLLHLQERGVAVVSMVTEYEQLLMRVPVAYLPEGWMFTSLSEWVRARDASNAVKRVVDVAGSLAGLLFLALAFPFVALAILADSRGRIFYRQMRLGVGGRRFRVLKFRTMRSDAEEDGPRWADAQDRRVTKVGKWLRRSRLDELPQVFNVLRGDMSLVGPRPERPEFVESLEKEIPAYRARLMVRPGLTGWAQVNADYASSADDSSLKLEYDLYYVKHRSFLFDAWILWKTAATVMALKGR